MKFKCFWFSFIARDSGLRWTLSQMVMQKSEMGLANPIDMMYHIQPWMKDNRAAQVAKSWILFYRSLAWYLFQKFWLFWLVFLGCSPYLIVMKSLHNLDYGFLQTEIIHQCFFSVQTDCSLVKKRGDGNVCSTWICLKACYLQWKQVLLVHYRPILVTIYVKEVG